MTDKACSECHLITNTNTCPRCKTAPLSDNFGGLAVIFDPEGSSIAKVMQVKTKGHYAIKVR